MFDAVSVERGSVCLKAGGPYRFPPHNRCCRALQAEDAVRKLLGLEVSHNLRVRAMHGNKALLEVGTITTFVPRFPGHPY